MWLLPDIVITCEISSSHGGEYDVQSCLLGCNAVRTSETSVDNHFTRQYNPEDSSEHSYNSYLQTNGTQIFQQNNYNKKPSLLLLTSIYYS
jgi:hypothetical protein